MDILKQPEANLVLAEDHRIENNGTQFLIMSNGKLIAAIFRQNGGVMKYEQKGILKQDADAKANANLFLAAPDMYEALHSLLDVITAKHEGGDEVIAAIRRNQIIKAKKAIQKAKGYV